MKKYAAPEVEAIVLGPRDVVCGGPSDQSNMYYNPNDPNALEQITDGGTVSW